VQAQRPGEIVFVGAGRIPSDQAARLVAPANFRLIAIDGPTEHVGLRKVSVHRAMDDPDAWEVFIAAKNYGAVPRSVPVTVAFGGSPVATRRFDLKPAAEQDLSFRFKTRAAGWLEARLATQDTFRQDSRAILELPPRGVLPVTVYSSEPDLLRPIFTAIPGIQPSFLPVSATNPTLTAASFSWIISRRLRRRPDKAFGWSRPPVNRPFRCKAPCKTSN
jgi:hypothetical protein